MPKSLECGQERKTALRTYFCHKPVGHPGKHRSLEGVYWTVSESERPTAAPPASAPPEHVHTCTDPGPLLARITELESRLASRDAEIARLQTALTRIAGTRGDDDVFGAHQDCWQIAERALAAPPDTTTETPHG